MDIKLNFRNDDYTRDLNTILGLFCPADCGGVVFDEEGRREMKPLKQAYFPSPRNKMEERYTKDNPEEEVYMNDLYQVNVRRGVEPLIDIKTKSGNSATLAHLSIKRLDKRALMDWRHLQWIKNEVVGEECEGVELFPAESRLVDNANQYHLWVWEEPVEEMFWPVGWGTRWVSEKSHMGETQRKWPDARKPEDLEKMEARSKLVHDKYEKGESLDLSMDEIDHELSIMPEDIEDDNPIEE